MRKTIRETGNKSIALGTFFGFLSSSCSFAGVMAFIFSDLVAFPVIRVNAKYYGQ